MNYGSMKALRPGLDGLLPTTYTPIGMVSLLLYWPANDISKAQTLGLFLLSAPFPPSPEADLISLS